MAKFEHLSVWLHLAEDDVPVLAGVIERLAAVHGTAVCPPHVTIVGGFDDQVNESVARCGQLAQMMSATEIVLRDIAVGRSLHRSIYLVVEPNPQLQRAFDAGVRLWKLGDEPPFEPHLSVQYSELPIEQKRHLAATVDLPLPMTVRGDRIALWCTDMSDLKRWRMIKDFPLSARTRSAPPRSRPAADRGHRTGRPDAAPTPHR